MRALPDPRLRIIAITNRVLCGGGQELLAVCARLLDAGLPTLMLREKDLPEAELLELSQRLKAMTESAGAIFLISGNPKIAGAVGAAGAHVGMASNIEEVRRQNPVPFLIGASCHSREELQRAAEGGADYAFLSPVWAPISKTYGLKPLGVEGFRELTEEAKLPIIALGGIDAARAPEVFAAGATGIAGIGTFFGGDGVDALRHILEIKPTK